VSSKLYLFHNDTSGTPPPASLAFWVPTLEVLFNLSGTPSAPVRDVTFAGLAFRDQRKSLLADWMVPSGGDWSLRRAGGLHFEGTERTTVSGCAFVRMDANAIFVGAYNRNTTIERNECVWHGMSCVVTFGYAEQNDCTAGEQPWGTQINFNLFHELGLQEMQSSAWFTGKTPLSHVEGNLWFNGPRAMANFNDGNCGGGSVFTRNLLFNTCRQSGDHGPANSWCVCKQPRHARALAQTSAMSCPLRARGPAYSLRAISSPQLPLPRHRLHQLSFAGTACPC
jgi:hypothetical protein